MSFDPSKNTEYDEEWAKIGRDEESSGEGDETEQKNNTASKDES